MIHVNMLTGVGVVPTARSRSVRVSAAGGAQAVLPMRAATTVRGVARGTVADNFVQPKR